MAGHSYADFDYWWLAFSQAFIVLFTLSNRPVGRPRRRLSQNNQHRRTARQKRRPPGDPGRGSDGHVLYLAGRLPHSDRWAEGISLGHYACLVRLQPLRAYWNVRRFNDVIAWRRTPWQPPRYVEELYYWRGMAYAGLGGSAARRVQQAHAYHLLHLTLRHARRVEAGCSPPLT